MTKHGTCTSCGQEGVAFLWVQMCNRCLDEAIAYYIEEQRNRARASSRDRELWESLT